MLALLQALPTEAHSPERQRGEIVHGDVQAEVRLTTRKVRLGPGPLVRVKTLEIVKLQVVRGEQRRGAGSRFLAEFCDCAKRLGRYVYLESVGEPALCAKIKERMSVLCQTVGCDEACDGCSFIVLF